jgi:hypothetical protein
MRLYRSIVGSTHAGNCIARACNADSACNGFGAIVDTAKTTDLHSSFQSELAKISSQSLTCYWMTPHFIFNRHLITFQTSTKIIPPSILSLCEPGTVLVHPRCSTTADPSAYPINSSTRSGLFIFSSRGFDVGKTGESQWK